MNELLTYDFKFKCVKCANEQEHRDNNPNVWSINCMNCGSICTRTDKKINIDAISAANLPDEFTITEEQARQLLDGLLTPEQIEQAIKDAKDLNG